jgi:hypothetical protein
MVFVVFVFQKTANAAHSIGALRAFRALSAFSVVQKNRVQ